MRFSPSNLQSSWQIPARWLRRFKGLSLKDLSTREPYLTRATPKVGLVLSCGGARGLAHVGVIQVLEEENVPVDVIIGSSMGSYVGALWASGISGKELELLAAEMKDRRTLIRMIDPVYPLSGLIRGFKLRKHLERTLGEQTRIQDLKRPMRIVATDLDTFTGDLVPDSIPVAAAVHASCAIPGICTPVKLDGHRYIDGGAAQPLPVRLMRQTDQVDIVIAVNVMPTLEDLNASRSLEAQAEVLQPTLWRALGNGLNSHLNFFAPGNLLDTFKRCLASAQLRLIADESEGADVLIHPFLSDSRWYDYENFNRYIEAGRAAAMEAMPRIRELLDSPILTKPDYETVPILTPVGCGSP